MGITLTYFRQVFRAFGDPQQYTDAEIEVFLQMSDTSMPVALWGEFRDYYQGLYVAHFLALNDLANRTAEGGGVPGTRVGVVTSKSLGGGSISYDTNSGAEDKGGMWNMTTYGRMWLHQANLIGAGGFQSGGPDIALGPTFGPPWPGVVTY